MHEYYKTKKCTCMYECVRMWVNFIHQAGHKLLYINKITMATITSRKCIKKLDNMQQVHLTKTKSLRNLFICR